MKLWAAVKSFTACESTHVWVLSGSHLLLAVWVDGWMNMWVDGCMGALVSSWMTGWMDGWMNKWVGGWIHNFGEQKESKQLSYQEAVPQ